MSTFEFTLRINRRLEEEADMDSVYARCADCSLLVEAESTLLQFHREASTLQDAIRSAIADVISAGFRVAQVELEADSTATQTA